MTQAAEARQVIGTLGLSDKRAHLLHEFRMSEKDPRHRTFEGAPIVCCEPRFHEGSVPVQASRFRIQPIARYPVDH